MARGNGKHSQVAQQAGKLSAFIKPKTSADELQAAGMFVDWGEVNGNLVTGALRTAVREGGALLFGCSRDKTCYSVKVYVGGDGTPYYFPCNAAGVESLEEFLLSIIAVGEWNE